MSMPPHREGWVEPSLRKPRISRWLTPAIFLCAAVYTWINPARVMGWFGVVSGDGPAGLERLGHYLAGGLAVFALALVGLAVTGRARAERRERESNPSGT